MKTSDMRALLLKSWFSLRIKTILQLQIGQKEPFTAGAWVDMVLYTSPYVIKSCMVWRGVFVEQWISERLQKVMTSKKVLVIMPVMRKDGKNIP
ncbi:hypothetical protein D3C86_2071660 [compost metagenome]